MILFNKDLKRFSYNLSLISLVILSFSLSSYSQKILSPEEFLGYPLGSRFTPHFRVVDYFYHISNNSTQVLVEKYGETYEHRPLILAFISNKENIQNLEIIRQNNLKLAGIVEGNFSGKGPAILWLSYNVHGNESVSTEASLATLYALANTEDQEKQKWLQNTVIIMDPVVNPDGRERYVNFYYQYGNKSPNPNPDSKEHREPWPGGRANHYLFDLNRDWAWQTQKESQQRLKVYNNWLPQVHVDFHEQGFNDPYYFAPAAEPLHEAITRWQRDFQEEIGKNHSRYFDQNNWLYFTKERFDLLYPSYGDTYPTYNGAIGMTYEQGGSGRAGLAVITAEKDTLTLRDRILHHYTTGISTIEISSIHADNLLREFEKFFRDGKSNPSSSYKSYVIKNPENSNKIRDLMEFLDKMGIRYGHGRAVKSLKGFEYSSKSNKSFSTQENDLIISAFQPKSALLQVLFDPNPHLTDSVTYDITSWSLPYVYDLETYATSTKINVEKDVVRNSVPKLPKENKPYAYISEWNSLNHQKFLSNLLAAGVKVRHTKEPFQIDGRNYSEGSLVITRSGNAGLGSSFDEIIIEEAYKLNINIQPTATGMVARGKDFGSSAVKLLHAPNVAVLSGKDISSLAFGEIWHYFEQDINYPITIIDTDYFKEINLSTYDVLILPSGDYNAAFTGEKMEPLKMWIKNGGTLILMEEALAFFAGKEEFELQKYPGKEENKENKEEEIALPKIPELYKNKTRKEISNYALGGIFKISLDNSHPLGYGYPTYYYTLKNNADGYHYLEKGWNVGTIKDENSLMSGFVGSKVKEKIKENLVFGVQEMGKGSIVYMVDNPLFRSFWYNGKLIFANAVFMVGQ